ncbi:adenosylcobinamide-GDP ribazoletransferase [Salinisphaera sp. T31B1]|uniref:adenosylcobinamide-GDP ribazoletransferase n=1 Tax=Salinisphaera sp. T31B1 TaxID=727963 RepID=UPI00333E99C3
MRFAQPLWLACALLTTLPVGRLVQARPTAADVGRSVACYPWVGWLLGILLELVAWVLPTTSPMLAAALLVVVWIALTGALHLDGLADCADAWSAGHADASRCLAVMKDPAAGPMGVAAVVCVVLLKVAALAALSTGPVATWGGFLLASIVLARAAATALMVTGRYVRRQGIASMQSAWLPGAGLWIGLVLAGALALCVLPLGVALWVLPAVIAWTLVWRRAWRRRIGGYTGDIVGGLIETVETLVLVVGALAMGGS